MKSRLARYAEPPNFSAVRGRREAAEFFCISARPPVQGFVGSVKTGRRKAPTRYDITLFSGLVREHGAGIIRHALAIWIEIAFRIVEFV